MKDILIIGQGIAGTMLSWEARQAGLSYDVMDVGALQSTSVVSSGIINPLTGSRFVKSWMVDDLIKVALESYTEIGKMLRAEVIYKTDIVRHIKDVHTENIWHGRKLDPAYEPHMVGEQMTLELKALFPEAHLFGEVRGYRVVLPILIKKWREFLQSENNLIEERFEEEYLTVKDDHVVYSEKTYRQLILANGYLGNNNQLFSITDYRPFKGEVLIVRMPDLHLQELIKYVKFIVPIGDDHYWIGSNYQHEFSDDQPDAEEVKPLLEFLDALPVDYEVLEHMTGIRPATRFRRPFVGTHPKHPFVHLCNGLGTKGASLGPYFARQLIGYIQRGETMLGTDAFQKAVQHLKV